MAFLGRANYEVHVQRDGRWIVDDILKSEQAALDKAKVILAKPMTEGVRVIRDWKRGNEQVENEIFCQLKTVTKQDDFSLNDVDDAPFCTKVQHYYETASRVTISRMFSKYLEKFEMTPTEVLHDHNTLRRLMNYDTLVPSAVDRIAKLHARTGQVDQKTRRDEIYDAVDKIAARAKKTSNAALPKLEDFDLDKVLAEIDREEEDERKRLYLATTALVRESLAWRGWLAKMGRLLPMARAQKDERALQLIDTMLADILNAKTVVKDVIGVSRHLGDAIMRMCDLLEGKCKPTQFADEELLEILNELFAAGVLPQSRSVVISRISRDLKSAVRITNSEEASEDAAYFMTLVERMITPDEVLGGGEVAFGLADRWSRLQNIGGVKGRVKAIQDLISRLEKPNLQVIFLLTLTEAEIDEELKSAIEDLLDDLLKRLNSIQAIAPTVKIEIDRLRTAKSLQDLMLRSKLPKGKRNAMAKMLDDVVADYIVEEKVIERLDDPSLPFRERADRLVKFCTLGVLTEGRATDIVRGGITTYLKRKDFVSEYTADIPDAAGKEAAVREFYSLLATTGFKL